MRQNKKEHDLYERVLKEHVSAVVLKRWSFNHRGSFWEKHEADEAGRQYTIYLNHTRGVTPGKRRLIREIVYILNDLEGIKRSNIETENKANEFYENNPRFVEHLWEEYATF